MTSGQRLLEFRNRKNYTQAKLLDLSCVPQTTISGIENTNKTLSLKTAIKRASALGIRVEELLPEEKVTK